MVATSIDDRCSDTPYDSDLCAAPADISAPQEGHAPIAVVGVACRFPRAKTPAALWDHIWQGQDAFGPVPKDRWAHEGFLSSRRRDADKAYVASGAFLEGVHDFAAMPLGISARRAAAMDPQHRLILEVAREALASAGMERNVPVARAKVGTFIGASTSEYRNTLTARLMAMHMASGAYGHAPEYAEEAQALARAVENISPVSAYTMPGTLLNMAASNVAFAWDFGGPAMSIDAACASSLVALHTAVGQLRSGQCDLALAGGVYLNFNALNWVCFSRIGAISKSGACRPFDARADGFLQGEGAGLVVLRRLEDAVADGDAILGVIRGVGVANDGRGDGPMAPRALGQVRALKNAYVDGGVDPASVAFVECHGTATPVGDPVELLALKTVLGEQGAPVALGSSKANFGHTMSAAGILGLIKALGVLQRGEAPAQAGFETPAKTLPLSDSRLFVPTQKQSLVGAESTEPLRVGVSAFGFGGANAHVVLERAPKMLPRMPSAKSQGWQVGGWAPQKELVVLSAPTRALLQTHIEEMAAALQPYADQASKPGEGVSLADVAYTLGVRRRWYGHRMVVLATDLADLIAQLRACASQFQEVAGRSLYGSKLGPNAFFTPEAWQDHPAKIAWMFPGQGSQAVDALSALRARFEGFRDGLSIAEAAVGDIDGKGLQAYLYPVGWRDLPAEDQKKAMQRLMQTEVCQPALTALNLSLARLLERMGLQPHVTLGHSLGEFSAAAAAGLFAADQAATLTAKRGAVMRALGDGDPGAMLACRMGAAEAQKLCAGIDGIVVANVNHPKQVVLSGRSEGIFAAQRSLEAQGIAARPLDVSHGFHSPHMAAAAEAFLPAVDGLSLTAPNVAVISAMTGQAYPGSDAKAREAQKAEGGLDKPTRAAIRLMLTDHATESVNFVDAVHGALDAGAEAFVEVGFGNTLSGLTRKILMARGDGELAVSPCCLPHAASDTGALSQDLGDGFLRMLGQMIALGHNPHMDMLYGQDAHRVVALPPPPLPQQTYTPYRAEPKPAPIETADKPGLCAEGAKRLDGADKSTMSAHTPSRSPRVVPNSPAVAVADWMQLAQEQTALLAAQARVMEQHNQMLQKILPQKEMLADEGSAGDLLKTASQKASQTRSIPSEAQKPVQVSVDETSLHASTSPNSEALPQKELASQNEALDIAEKVMDVVASVSAFPRESLRPEMVLAGELGFDSLMFGDLMTGIAQAFNNKVEIPQSILSQRTRIQDIIAHLEENHGSADAALGSHPNEKAGQELSSDLDAALEVPLALQAFYALWQPAAPVVPLEGCAMAWSGPACMAVLTWASSSAAQTDAAEALIAELRLRGVDVLWVHLREDLFEMGALVAPMAQKQDQSDSAVHGGLWHIDAPAHAAHAAAWLDGIASLPKPLAGVAAFQPNQSHDPRYGLAYWVCLAAALPASARKVFALLAQGDAHDPARKAFCATEEGFAEQAWSLEHAVGAGFVAGLAREWPEAAVKHIAIQGVMPQSATLAFEIGSGVGPSSVAFIDGVRHHRRWLPTGDALHGDGEAQDEEDPTQALLGSDVSAGANPTQDDSDLHIGNDAASVLNDLNDSNDSNKESLWLKPSDAVVITGGLGSLGQKIGLLLAAECGVALILIGRRPADCAEAREHLANLKAAGAREVLYLAQDLASPSWDSAPLVAACAKVGGMRMVVHTAGAVSDALVAAQSQDRIQKVFDAKVLGLHALLEGLSSAGHMPEAVWALSSWAAHFGNPGQTVYAAANRGMEAVLAGWRVRFAEFRARVSAWPPWQNSSMADSIGTSHRDALAGLGVPFVPDDLGLLAVARDLAALAPGQNPTALGAAWAKDVLWGELALPESAPPTSKMVLGQNSQPYLVDHTVKGRALMPLAMALDHAGWAAMAGWEQRLAGAKRGAEAPPALIVDDLALFRGVEVGDEKEGGCHADWTWQRLPQTSRSKDASDAALFAGTLRFRGSDAAEASLAYRVQVGWARKASDREDAASSRAATTQKSAQEIVHAVQAHPAHDLSILPMDLHGFYRDVAFHGPMLQAVKEVVALGPKHGRGIVQGTKVRRWIPGSQRSAWAIDPCVVDGSFQLASYWLWVRHQELALPVAIGRFTRFAPLLGSVVCTFIARKEGASEVVGDIVYQNERGDVLALAEEVRAQFVAPEGLVSSSIMAQMRTARKLWQAALPLDEVMGASRVESRIESRIESRAEQSQPEIKTHKTQEQLHPNVATSAYRVADFPEIKALQDRLILTQKMGLQNPYFHANDGIARDTSVVEGKRLIHFSGYNYLGASGEADVAQAAKDAIDRYGTSVSASRVASGQKPLHAELECALADAVGVESALVFSSGHATNETVIGHLLDKKDLIIHDALAHNSIQTGAMLSGAKRMSFPHEDAEGLDRMLTSVRGQFDKVLIAIEGVYSMDGDITRLKDFIRVKNKHKALLFVDEAHSFGVVGATGRGVAEHFGVDPREVDVWMGTLSKSLASCGGYVAGSAALIEYLKYTAPGFVFSAGISPANAAAALAALRLMLAEPERVQNLQARAALFVELAQKVGIDTGLSAGSGVVPAIVGNSMLCLKLSEALALRGINVQPIVYPAVDEDASRLRFFIGATHSKAQIKDTVAALHEELGKLQDAMPQMDAGSQNSAA